MSIFFSPSLSSLSPYTPGEQPQDLSSFIKLNTNENPYSLSSGTVTNAVENMRKLNLYPDPLQKELREKLASLYGVDSANVSLSNGSDEMLLFCFLAFCARSSAIVTPDITYSFYNTLASLVGLEVKEIPLLDDFTVDVDAFCRAEGTVVLANPNALTGIALSSSEIEKIISSDRKRMCIIDEAYADFGGESVLPLIRRYKNLVVIRTFSKSRSLAGARLGYAFADKDTRDDIERVRGSINPYNINSFTLSVAYLKLCEEENTLCSIEEIRKIREYTKTQLEKLGFTVLPSSSNFLFVTHPLLPAESYYSLLKERGILVRHFTKKRIEDYSRITIGKREDMLAFLSATEEILNERK